MPAAVEPLKSAEPSILVITQTGCLFVAFITGKDACEIAYNGELLEEGALGSERKLEHYQAATNHGSEGK